MALVNAMSFITFLQGEESHLHHMHIHFLVDLAEEKTNCNSMPTICWNDTMTVL
jgi:hypothetical protein